MTKREFSIYLRKKLRRFGDGNAEDAVAYYEEIIDEKIRDGMSETQAVASLGDPAKIVANTATEMVAGDKVKNPALGIGLIIGLLSPVLFPFALVILILYLVVFVVYAALVVSFAGAAVASVIGGFMSLTATGGGAGILTLGISFIVAVILAALCVVIAKYGKAFIDLITVKLVQKIKKNKNRKTETK